MVEKMEGLEKLEKCFKNLDSPATSGSGMEAAKPILYWCILRLHLWKTVEEPVITFPLPESTRYLSKHIYATMQQPMK